MKKVLILTNNSGGLYGFRRELISELQRRGCEVSASTPFDESVAELEAMGCRLLHTEFERRGVDPLKDIKLFAEYLRLLKRERPDVVITYTVKPNVYGGSACRLLRIPYAANITGLGTAFEREGALQRLVTALYRVSLKKAKAVFFENAENQALFLARGLIRARQGVLLSGAGVSLERFSLQPYPHNVRFRFLFIGRIMREKGVEELFSAMERLRAEGNACELDVLGEYEEDYREQIARFEAAGWLRYHGYQTDVRPYIREADCLVLPSWHEGMANTNLECAASGRPVITSDIPGCREAVVDGVSGFLCESRNADSLYAAMKKMLELPAQTRSAMGLSGRKHMAERFDKQKVVKDTTERIL